MSEWSNIIKINDDSHIFIANILDSYLGQRFDPLFIKFFSLNIARRLVFIQKGISPHLTDVGTKPQLELPIGILLRTACLDILQYGYIIKCMDEIKIGNPPQPDVIPDYSNIENEFKKIYSENIKNQIEDYKALKATGTISNEEFDNIEKQYKEEFSWLLTDENKSVKAKRSRAIFKVLKEEKKYDVFSNVFEDYSYYSKLEHFGILSWYFTIPDKENIPIILHKIKRNIMTILKTYQICFVYLQRDEKDIAVIDEWLSQVCNIEIR